MGRIEDTILGIILAVTIIALLLKTRVKIDISAAITLILYQINFIIRTLNDFGLAKSLIYFDII